MWQDKEGCYGNSFEPLHDQPLLHTVGQRQECYPNEVENVKVLTEECANKIRMGLLSAIGSYQMFFVQIMLALEFWPSTVRIVFLACSFSIEKTAKCVDGT
jgi:hypothetical protein